MTCGGGHVQSEGCIVNFPVTNLISSAFALASSQQRKVKEDWVSISHGVGSLLPDSLLLASIQNVGNLDVLLRCMEIEREPCVSRPQDFGFDVHLTFHYQLLFSRIWICDLYEVFRLLKSRNLITGQHEFDALANDLKLLRIAMDKHEIANDRQLSQPLCMRKLSSRNEVTGEYVYAREDPRRAHIMGEGLSSRGSVMWNALDAASLDDRWLERLSLSERVISFLSSCAQTRLREAGAQV